jgi:large subunit ribosomal protein L30
MARKLLIRLVRSPGGHPAEQRRTVLALGIRRLRHQVEHNDTPQIRGMVFKVRHLVEVAELP